MSTQAARVFFAAATILIPQVVVNRSSKYSDCEFEKSGSNIVEFTRVFLNQKKKLKVYIYMLWYCQ